MWIAVLVIVAIVVLVGLVFRLSSLDDALNDLRSRLDETEKRLAQLNSGESKSAEPAPQTEPSAPPAVLALAAAPPIIQPAPVASLEPPPLPASEIRFFHPSSPQEQKPVAVEAPPPLPVSKEEAEVQSSKFKVQSSTVDALTPALSHPMGEGEVLTPGQEPSAPPLTPPAAEAEGINWEQFMGVKLLAYAGGFALFLTAAFFLKYAFENNLISPEMRVALGFVAGLGLLVGGVLLRRKEYVVTAQTLCATGVVILYTTTYACRSIYHFAFFHQIPTFAIMVLITITAFALAVRMEAQVVAVLGILGGFLTPVLVSANIGKPFSLFSYIALLDAGLIAVALRRRWHYLTPLGALGTVAIQIGWVVKFFEAAKVYTALTVLLGFDALFLAGVVVALRQQRLNDWLSGASLGISSASLAFALYLMNVPGLQAQPWTILILIFGADLFLLGTVWLEPKFNPVQMAAGAAVWVWLAVWTLGSLPNALMNWALGAYVAFALLHGIFPLVLRRRHPDLPVNRWGHLFPPLALLLVMGPILQLDQITWFFWPCVLLIDLVAVALVALTASAGVLAVAVILTASVTAAWLSRFHGLGDMTEILAVIGGFAVFFYLASLGAGWRGFGLVAAALGGAKESAAGSSPVSASAERVRAQIPALSAILPFLLLLIVIGKLRPPDPSPVFGLGMLMAFLLLGVCRMFAFDVLTAVGLGCALALEYAWHEQVFNPAAATVPLLWYLVFYAAFTVFPFVFWRWFQGRSPAAPTMPDSGRTPDLSALLAPLFERRTLPWAVAALSGPLHFYLVHNLVKRAWPNDVMGLLPAGFAAPALLGLLWLVRKTAVDHPRRLTLLAWFGGAALFFITLIFPVQFERQWITIGWALEGAALLWLFHRVPHPGLRLVGVGLLITAFVRLALNPAVLAYQPRADAPILNWYLYAYGLVTLSLFLAGWLLRPPRHQLIEINVSAVLVTLGVILAFLLLNIEIADYFTTPGTERLTFEFSGNFGRDMTYSIAWALYALLLVVAGVAKAVRPARYAGLALLSITLLKLFFHDFSQLKQLYRIGAFLVVAVIAILASFLYQWFFARNKRTAKEAK